MESKLSALVDIPKVQGLLTSHFAATGIPAALFDAGGNRLASSRAAELAACTGEIEERNERFALVRCTHGLTQVSLPIELKGSHLGELRTGWLHLEEAPHSEAHPGAPTASLTALKQQLRFLGLALDQIIECGLLRLQQQEAHQAHLAGEIQARSLIKQFPHPVFLKDRHSVFLACNERLAQDLGIQPDEIVGKTDLDFYPRPLAEKYRADDQRIMREGKPESLEEKYLCRGEERFIRTTKTPLRDEQGRIIGIFGVIFDITEEKKADTELKEREEQLRTLIDAMPDIVCFKDGQGRWLEANPFDLKLFQLEGVPYKGKKDSELAAYSSFYRESFLGCEDSDEIAWKKGSLSRGEEAIEQPDGSVMVFDIIKVPLFYPDGSRKGLVVIGRDITARKQAEDHLRESEARQRIMLEHLPVGVVISSIPEQTMIFRNHRFFELFGYSEEELPSVNEWWILAYPDPDYREEVVSEWQRRMEDAVRRQGAITPIEVNITAKDGTVLFVRVHATAIGDQAFVTFINLTDWKKAEDSLKRLTETLEERVQERTHQLEEASAEKIRLQRQQIETLQKVDRLKDDFLSAITHELRTPLNAITGFGSILEDEVAGPLSPEQHEFVAKLLNSSEKMLALVNDLLDFAKIRAGRFEISPSEVDYPTLVEEAVSLLTPQIQAKGQSLEVALALPEPHLVIDGNRIQQVLLNLLTNAHKFTPRGGTIRLKSYLSGNDLVTEISDDGIGIAKQDLEKLFQPFLQLEGGLTRKPGGTGLGLSISKGIVEAHGGTILATSPGLGKGSTFSFTLPRNQR